MKKLYTLIMIFFLSFIFSVDVKADEFIDCEYQNTNNSNDIIIISIDKDTLISRFTNKLGSSQPFFPLNLVSGSNNSYMFDNDNGDVGYYYLEKEKKVVSACPNSIINYYENNSFENKIEVAYIASNGFLSGKSSPLKMPIIYFNDNGVTASKEKAKLFNAYGGISNNEFSEYKKVTYNFKGFKSNDTPIDENGEISCNYKSSGKNGIYNFKFKTDKSLNHKYSYNSGEYKTIILDSERIEIKSCPSVIKVGGNSMTTFTISTPDACYYDNELCFYEESVSPYYGNNGTLITYYTEYRASNSKISVYIDVSNNITISDSISEINVQNLNDYSSIFLNKTSSSYPKYLVKEIGTGVYKFVNSKKDENGNAISFDKIYININELGLNGTGLGEEKIYATCNELFGDTLLGFIRNDILPIIWIGVPILLILFTSFDFAKVVFVDDKEGIQHAFQRFIKRAIAALLIFLTPTILVILVDVIGAGDTVQSCIREMRKMGSTSWIKK